MSEVMQLGLTDDEALVLHEMLARWFDDDETRASPDVFDHPAERALLENVLGAQLDKLVPAIFDPRYRELVDEARNRISARYESIPN